MRFKLFSTKIYVSYIFMAVITITLATDKTGLVMPVIFAVIMHEIGHLFAMWILNCQPKQINLIPGSVQIVRKFTFKQNGEIYIALSGPIVNLLLFIVFLVNYYAFKNTASLSYAAINLLLALFNLMPVRGVDGGTVLYESLLRGKYAQKADIILKIFTLLVAALLLLVGLIMIINGKINLSFVLLGIYFAIAALVKM